jgi:hypothetical protein
MSVSETVEIYSRPLNIIQLAPSEEHFQAAGQTFIARYFEFSLETATFVQDFVWHNGAIIFLVGTKALTQDSSSRHILSLLFR